MPKLLPPSPVAILGKEFVQHFGFGPPPGVMQQWTEEKLLATYKQSLATGKPPAGWEDFRQLPGAIA